MTPVNNATPAGNGGRVQDRAEASYHGSLADATKAVSDFGSAVFAPEDVVEIRRLPSRVSAWVRAADLPQKCAELSRQNANGINIYIGANPRVRFGAKGHDSVSLARCLCADFDHGTVADVSAKIVAAKLPPPTVLVNSGHAVQAYWRLTAPVTDMERWRSWQQALATVLETDPALHCLDRLMFLPGFLNMRDRPHSMCELVRLDPTQVCSWAELEEVLNTGRNRSAEPAVAPPLPVDPPCLVDDVIAHEVEVRGIPEGVAHCGPHDHHGSLVRESQLLFWPA